MKIVFFGTPEFSVPALRALQGSGHEVSAAVTQPDRKRGRGRHVTSSPVKVEAEKSGVKVLQPESVSDPGFLEELKGLAPDLIVVVAYGRILPPGIIHLPESGCVNIHASLLPKYRGAAPVNWAIINGEKKTGITIMMMDEGLDTGPVLLTEETPIWPQDTAGTVSQRLSGIGAALLVRALEGLEKGTLRPVPQSGPASYAPVMKKTDGFIRWSAPAAEICNRVRGMNPWPGAYGFVGSERYKILRAEPLEYNAREGLVVKATGGELHVGAGRGTVSVLEIQPSGKPPMPVNAFLQGRRLREGMKFEGEERK